MFPNPISCCLVALVLAACVPACTAGPPPRPQGPAGGAPPREMIEACKEKKAGEACSGKGERGEFQGTCAESSRGQLGCRPDGNPPGPPPGEPPGPPNRG